uniref:MACPF domain-containing protein n=1 Tax=Ciona savignyi TaxID=51511 RepID=H2YD80_CIOSA
MSVQHGSSFTKSAKEEMSVVIGGSSSAAAKLSFSREASEKSYNDWVETVKHNPSIIDYELRPISDVIPDHAKKANMERALFHYMGKYDDAACKGGCYNGAAVVVTDGGESCTCLCKPPYRGVDCHYT